MRRTNRKSRKRRIKRAKRSTWRSLDMSGALRLGVHGHRIFGQLADNPRKKTQKRYEKIRPKGHSEAAATPRR